jgi:hypothetical protein
MRLYLSGSSRTPSVESTEGISARKDSILELIFSGNGSNLEALLQNPNFSTPLWLIVWDPNIINAVINSQTAMNAVANSQTAMNAVINSQTALNAIRNNTTAWDIFINSPIINVKEVPTMTSNTTPEGAASTSSIYSSSYGAFKAFDKNTDTYWQAGGSAPQWIQYQFVSPVFVHTITLTGYGSYGNVFNPNSITTQASDDGSTFIDIQTFNQEFTNTTTTLYIAKQGYYKYWRVRVNNTVGSGSYPIIKELNFKGFIQPA